MDNTNPVTSVADELLKLKSLLDAGALTQEEFDQGKAEVLAQHALPAQPMAQPAPQPMPQPVAAPAPQFIPPVYAAPAPVYAPAPAPPQQKKSGMLPLFIALGGFVFLAVILAGGFLLNERIGWLEIGSWGEKTVEDYAVTVSFPEVEREGTYSGAIRRRVPNGEGVFTAQTDEGVKYTLEGTWTDGMVNGKGKLKYDSGEAYDGEFQDNQMHGHGIYSWNEGASYYEGDFKGGWVANQQEYDTVDFVERQLERQSNYKDVWRQLLREFGGLFPAKTQADINALAKVTRADVKYAQLDKNTQKYAGEFLQYKGQIVQIEESNGKTRLIVVDNDLNVYYLIYMGETEFLKNATVRFVATPICGYSYDNVSGGTTNSIAMLACRIYK